MNMGTVDPFFRFVQFFLTPLCADVFFLQLVLYEIVEERL